MNVLSLENGLPKQVLLSASEVESLILQYMSRCVPQYGNLMPIENIQSKNVLGNTVYVITLESEEEE